MSTPPAPSQTILLLGSGITALQTAVSLLTHPLTSHHSLILIATHAPGDLSLDYTSPWAGGHWRSAAGEGEVKEWDARTYGAWRGLCLDGDGGVGKVGGGGGKLGDGGEKDGKGKVENETTEERTRRIGLGIKKCEYFWAKETEETKGKDGSGIWWRDVVEGFRILNVDEHEEAPKHTKAVFGVEYESICINVPRYLRYLLETATTLGAVVIKATVDTSAGLKGVVLDARRIALLHDPGLKEEDIAAIINCTGLGARHFLPASEAANLYPIRGQTILVKGEAKMARTLLGFGRDDELAYVIPRPGSGTTILGGVKQAGNWDEEVDESTNGRILDVVKREGLCEELRGEEGEFEVLGCQLGFRPGRKGGPRVEVEKFDGVEGDGRVEGVWVVHCYGHGGAGYQNSVGCAEKVVGLVVGCGI